MPRERKSSVYNWLLILLLSGGILSCAAKRPRQPQTLRVPAQYGKIQEAIDAASAGDTVLVAPGHYYETLVLKPGVIVRSEGSQEEHRNHSAARRTIIDANGELKPVVEGADGAVIDGFTLTGLGKVDHHQPGHPHGVQSRGTSPIIINNIIHHMGSTGIGSHMHEGRPAAPYIANNIVYANHGLGIGNNHESSATVIGNIIYDNEELGIGSKNGAHPLIKDNKVYNNGLSGIGSKDGAFPIIQGNEVYNNGLAGDVDNGGGIVIGNTFVPVVENNKVYSNFTIGIGLGNGVSVLLRNNESYNNRWVGLALAGTKNARVIKNKIHHNDKVGIGIHSRAQGVIINNEIYSNMFSAFSPYSKKRTKLIIRDNKLQDNGIFFSGEAKPRRKPGSPGPPQTIPMPDFLKH